MRHFSHFIEGQDVCLFTYHKPLVFAFTKKSDPVSHRQQRHLSFVSEFTTKVKHVSGKQNIVADALSRITAIRDSGSDSDVRESVSDQALLVAQTEDPETPLAATSLTALKFRLVEFSPNIYLWCDVSKAKPRPWVPLTLRRMVFDSIHSTAHPGSRTGKHLVAKFFVWHGRNRDVTLWTKNCMKCQQAKITRNTRAPVEHMEIPSSRFQIIHVDIVGPLETSGGFRYLSTAVDQFSRWPEAIPMSDITAVACAHSLLAGWICRFGVPDTIITDRGAQRLVF